jgi:hypothetical protein
VRRINSSCKYFFAVELTNKKIQHDAMLSLNDEQREYRETLTGHGRVITETHYSRDNTRLYELSYEATVGGGKGEFIVGGVGRAQVRQISRPAQEASMSTKQKTRISPAFSDAVVAELRAAINNNAPINETVFSSLLPSQKVAWLFEPVGKGLYVSTNAFGTTSKHRLLSSDC